MFQLWVRRCLLTLRARHSAAGERMALSSLEFLVSSTPRFSRLHSLVTRSTLSSRSQRRLLRRTSSVIRIPRN
ncbi:hypothetical protein BGZ57DRAFT_876219 [Hyaloscypha finlandica]|nr:hypothetical protein BGZ57DRAFT_876219 [Hyaloscypha finlandica]